MSILTILYAVIIFCLLIFVHELGHLIAAKSVGIKVNEFALGMGPRIFKFRKGETDYALRALPIGGACVMEGEDKDSEDPRGFNNKGFFAKAVTVVAGSFMNLLLAVLLLAAVIFSYGVPGTSIDAVSEGSPAEAAGLMGGDTIAAINGAPIEKWDDVGATIQNSQGDVLELTIIRGGESTEISCGYYEGEDGLRKIGVLPGMERRLSNIFPSIGRGAVATVEMGKSMIRIIGQLFTGETPMTELTGPVGIVYVVSDVAKNGIFQLAQLAALISLNLGIVNMLPLPALDGGRLLFLIIRKLTGKVITDEMEGRIHLAGLLLLFGLMIFVTFQDVTRFII
ncbi:MAG: RIP metalloprotease RseP [Clostridiales Family XIII bacterium]|jgi:regulator of sigma E protease|nr:RIP metalloprotease RseP [Clostridiales Family XIII bacterium]